MDLSLTKRVTADPRHSTHISDSHSVEQMASRIFVCSVLPTLVNNDVEVLFANETASNFPGTNVRKRLAHVNVGTRAPGKQILGSRMEG